jgi:cytochrome c-type biogenesis protein CcsB
MMRVLMMFLVLGCSAVAAKAQTFSEDVDLSPLGLVAVQNEGRLKSFRSHANAMMNVVSGPRLIAGQSPDYTYLDMLFRPEAYHDADCIYVKNKLVRNIVADAIESVDPSLADRVDVFRGSGLIAPALLERPEVAEILTEMESDLIRTAKQVDAIRSARFVMHPSFLLSKLRVVPHGNDDAGAAWHGITEIMLLDEAGVDPAVLEQVGPQTPIEGVDLGVQKTIAASWQQLVNGWGRQDAGEVNSAVSTLAAALATANPAVYPPIDRLAWEAWYFEHDQMTRGWLIYLLAIIFLLLAVVYRWKWALWTGLLVFAVAAGYQTFSVWLRWEIADRWPNSNMFEAVTTSSWFVVVLALVVELLWLRRTALRGVLPLGAAVTAMVALMTAHFLPVYLNPNISNMMPVLHDVWLYIHTNVIIFSYAIIFMGAVTAVLYLVYRILGGKAVYARAGGAGALLMKGPDGHSLADLDDGEGSVGRRRDKFGEVLDGSTMILMELAFIMLFTGLTMGAIWADHSWGRPWGWDPKEVFALNTFIIFALLIHVRMKVKDKGLWTAILAVVGAAVMLFNWIVINFVITGLHSYA